MKLTMWQWLTIVWLVVLHVVPYGIIYANAGSLETLHWVLWGILSAPCAEGSLLGFQLIAGGMPVSWRRLISVSGILTIMAAFLTLFNREVILIGLTAAISLLVVAVGGWLASRFLRDLPRVRAGKAHFALWEILATTCLIGLLLTTVRIADMEGMPEWRLLFDPQFCTFAFISGLFGLACVAMVTAATIRRKIGWGIGCLLLWGLIPWINLALFYLYPESLYLEVQAYLILLYPAVGVQMMMIWGTLFPLKIAFPGFLREPQSREEETPDEVVESEDFAEMR